MTYNIISQLADSGDSVYVYQDVSNQKNVPLNSLYSPEKEAEKFLRKVEIHNKVIILIGSGNGAVIRKLLDSTEKFIHLLVIEPFKGIFLDTELFSDKENVTFFQYESMSHLTFLEFIQDFNSVETELLIHPNYDRTESNLLHKIIMELTQTIRLARVNQNTQENLRKEWIIEPLLNLEYNAELTPLQELKDLFIGEKAILVASGPSMKELIPFVKNAQKSAYVLAAGSAINGLLHHDIVPDFAASFDSSQINFEAHFKDTKYSGPLFVGSIVNNDILKYHKGPTIVARLSGDHITKRALPELMHFKSVPSVAVFGLQILQYLGFSEIYLVGQDLALVNGKYYSEGVKEHKGSINQKAELLVESNSGDQVPTTYGLYPFLHSFVELIKIIDKSKTKIFNLSKHGAKIDGAPYIEEDKVVFLEERKEIHFSVNPKVSSINGLTITDNILEEIKSFKKDLEKSKKDLDRLNPNVVSVTDMKRVIRLFSRTRNHTIFEDVVTPQFSFVIQRISNIFQYKLEKPSYTSEDRLEMVTEIKKLFQIIDIFLESIMQDMRIIEVQNRIHDNIKQS
ncbi:motility associated factor glycosyltransferase family protein [Brevibacillus sp. SYSU BS000544]|uniref:motility associated factor glycosyltransferase family protein n=1 Tax=Brevibacillus sp. SYSU BS000544 TaxID=3416443 RepID=UPI003CE5513A